MMSGNDRLGRLLERARARLVRLEPTTATHADVEWIVLCNEGYSSSLAAATLQLIGLRRATDVIGGFLLRT